MNVCKAPETTEEFEQYYQLRWQVLRQPWGKTLGSEQDELEQQSVHRMIIDENKQTLAVGRLHKTDQHHAQIRYMAVSPDAQGQGLGKKMIIELELAAEKIGVTKISLNAREVALSFYLRLGYIEHGFSHLLYDEIKHFSMTKLLTPPTEHLNLLTQELQQTWHQTIPMSKAMNMEISYYDKQQLITSCDFAFNKNLHNTMFAGSIYTHATLTGWGWVYLQLKHANIKGDIVLADGRIRYHAPAKGPATAQINMGAVVGDINPLQKTDNTIPEKARFKLSVQVVCGDEVVASFEGLYFVIPK